MKKSTHKRLTAWLLTLALVVTLLPGMGMTALAVEDGGEGNGPPAAEVVEPEDGNSGSDETVGTPPSTEPESKEEDKTTEGEGGSSGSDYDIGDDTQPQGPMWAPVMPTATGDYPAASAVSVDGGKYFGEPGCYYFKNGASACSKDPNNYNAYYDPNTGTLTLNGYNGGTIAAGGTGSKITVVLIGTNSINNGELDSPYGGDITVTSSGGGTLSITNTQTITNSNAAIGIRAGYSGSFNTGNVTVKGNAKVTINMTHNGESGYEKAYGIYAKENITISENASVDITCATPKNSYVDGGNCNGLYAVKDVTIDTEGKIKIDVTNAGAGGTQSYGIYPIGTATLSKVGEMQVQWKKHVDNSNYAGGAVLRGASFDTTTHAVNVDKDNCYASYRYGTPRTVTVVNGTLTGPGVKYAKAGSGKFLAGDKVNIKPDTKNGKSGEEIPFKEWTSSDVTLTSPTTANTSFNVPAKNVTVTAKYSPFDGKPTFTPTGDLNNRGVLTFKTMVKPYDGNEYFALVKVGNEGNYNNGINPDTSSTSKPYVYTYEASSGHSSYYVEPGDYYVAETLNGAWYLSDPFTVNYVKPRPEISVSYWPDPTVFPSEEVGYAYAQARILTIENKGTAATGVLTITVEGANPTAFTVNPSSITNIEAGKSAMSTVRPKTGLAAGIYTATLKIRGDNVNTLSLNMKFTVTDPNASATVSGTIKSYGSASEAVTVTLLQGTSEVATKTLTGASGSVPYSQNYSFPAIPAGTYTLKVEKKGHAPWTEEITVDSTAITKDVTVYLWGDVNRDGEATAADAQEIQRNAAGLSSVFDTDPNSAYCTLRADVNRDGAITAADAQEIQRKAAGLSSTISSLP